MKFCSNCGKEVNSGAAVCLSCGHLIQEPKIANSQNGKALSTISVVFGSLGFYPLIIIGSIVGMITGIVGIFDDKNQYKGRSKIGLWLSIGSLAFWVLLIILIIIVSSLSY